MDSAFNSEILAEKLSKLNNSQQSIQSLSSWCITHRKKARQIVETWEKLFNSSSEEKKVSFLYLANDILQNSRRKGNEFVSEFWKVLPGALKSVYGSSEDLGKKVVLRLVGIWDERKVFGSRGRGLKEDILGQEPPALLDNNGNSSAPIKVVRKDAQTIRFKLSVGGMPEKIATAYTLLDEHSNEDTALNKCEAAVHLVGKMEKAFDDACSHGNLQGLPSVQELQEHEATLKQCVDIFSNIEVNRAALVMQLKEALEEQESKLDQIRSQMQVAQTESEHAANLRQRLIAATVAANTTGPLQVEVAIPSSVSASSFANSSTSSSEDQQKKAAAAAMAAKLAASTSSAQMLTSVLSSLVAEEAASKNNGTSPKRPKLDTSNSYYEHLQQQMGSVPFSTMQVPPFPPPPPPLPPVPPPPRQQFVQTPFAFTTNPHPPPPPLPASVSMGLARPSVAPPLPPMPPPLPPTSAGFYQPPGMGFYGQQPQTAPPVVPRQ